MLWLMSEYIFHDIEDGSQERQLPSDDRPAINDGLPHHKFEPSEFAPESGRCDKCGGGPDAPIHQKPVDQVARIADALERIAKSLELVLKVFASLGEHIGRGGGL
jgi:hypothetical protein